MNKPKNLTMIFNDLREEIDLNEFINPYEVTTELIRKQAGIVLKHRQNEFTSFELCTKRNHLERFQVVDLTPIYPEDSMPDLASLLNRDDHLELDESRFRLLKWMINENLLKEIDLKELPNEYFLDLLTLAFLCFNGFITAFEAKVILITIDLGQKMDKDPRHHVPEIKLLPLTKFNIRGFKISFLFTKYFNLMRNSLEVTGLLPAFGVLFL